jgi:two-component system alkaline phosphatase synthesis response regulator PhoP
MAEEKNKKILMIEDEKIIVDLLKSKLEKEGYNVIVGRDGVEGIEKMKEEKPDLILLDVVMPRKGGFEVIEERNKNEELKKIPVIIISNSGQPVELDKAKELGAVDWLVKTEFDPLEVITKVKKQIG